MLNTRTVNIERPMKYYLSIVFLLFSSMSFIVNAESENRAFASFAFENDVFLGDDGLYSNGLFITWGYNDIKGLDKQNLPSWIAYLAQQTHLSSSDISTSNKQYAVSYGFGHLLQTSIDFSVAELVEEDAPYVGLLAWDVNLLAYDEVVSDEVGLILGAVGPMVGGKHVQYYVHDWIGSSEPKGWDNQINNELVFRAQARRTLRLYETEVTSSFLNGEFDFLAGVDGGVGNLRSDIATGIGMRFGRDLKRNFSSATVFPVQKFNGFHASPYGWNLFLNLSASYVANDIFINGNTFSDSHSVELIHPQAAISMGFMANIYDVSILFTLLHMTDEYEGQAEATQFGSIAFTYHF